MNLENSTFLPESNSLEGLDRLSKAPVEVRPIWERRESSWDTSPLTRSLLVVCLPLTEPDESSPLRKGRELGYLGTTLEVERLLGSKKEMSLLE